MTDPVRRILIFGGTFDPPHRAHSDLPPRVAERIGCDSILYVPASINPLKQDTPPTPAEHRLTMLRRAVRDVPGADIATLELERPGPSYTVDTLEDLQGAFNARGENVEMRLLIGADQARDFHRWRDWRRIIDLAAPAVMLRPPWDRDAFQREMAEAYGPEEAARWASWTVEVPVVDVSSSEVRRRLREGGDLSDMLHPDVIEYIHEHGLYGVRQTTR